MYDIAPEVEKWILEGRQIALATVVRTWGSGPRREGAKMAVTGELLTVGSVSGGCVEGSVIETAQQCLEDGQPRRLHFGISNDLAWEVGLTCGGELDVWVEPLDQGWWTAVRESSTRNQPVVTLLPLEVTVGAGKAIVDTHTNLVFPRSPGSGSPAQPMLDAAVQALTARRSGIFSAESGEFFLDCHLPRPRLIIVGGAHVAVALQSFARTLGFRVILVDPRGTFATPQRFPDVEKIILEYPQDALPRLNLDADSYLAVLTHDPKIDDPTLLHALPSAAPYVGVLSSRKTHKERTSRLIEAGLDPALLDRIRTPIGIDIGARTPEEIALAVMGEIVKVRNRRTSSRK